MIATLETKNTAFSFVVSTRSAMKAARMIPTPSERARLFIMSPTGKIVFCVTWDGERYSRIPKCNIL